MTERVCRRLREREGGFASFINPLPTPPPNPFLSSSHNMRYRLDPTKGGLHTLHRFDERSRCPESVIGLLWNQ